MPDLGKKFECFNCKTKFYDLGKPEAICPKCGANQKDARLSEETATVPRPRRSATIVIPPEEEPEFEDAGHESEEEAIDTAAFADEEEFENEEPLLEPGPVQEEEDF